MSSQWHWRASVRNCSGTQEKVSIFMRASPRLLYCCRHSLEQNVTSCNLSLQLSSSVTVWIPISAYRRTHSRSQVACSEGRRPHGAVPHSPDDPNEVSQWPCGHADSTVNIVLVIRSTSKSRPNNIREGEKCPSVRTSVRPQKVSSIWMKFGI